MSTSQVRVESIEHLSLISITDPSIRDDVEKFIPSRKTRKENLGSIPVQCDAQCGKTLPRSELKVCSRCKQARYCSQACQKTHWQAGHKVQCIQGSPTNLTLKLAERALAVPQIVEYLWMHAILTLELLFDPSNANRFVVNVQCTTLSADIQAFFRRAVPGDEPDMDAQVVLSVSQLVRVPVDDAPARTRKIAANTWEKFVRDGLDAEGNYAVPGSVVVAFYFTDKKGDGGKDGSVSVAFMVPAWVLAYMASKPKEIIRSATFGDTEVDVNMPTLRNCINSFIRNDKENKLRLRGYPTGKPAVQE